MMRSVVPVLCILLQLTSGSLRAGSRRTRCGAEKMEDFAHVIAGYASKEQRCLECETAMAAYRCRGFEYMYGEFRKMCLTYKSKLTPESCLNMLDMYKDEIHYILWDLKVPDPEACKFVLGCGDYNNTVYNWVFDVPKNPLPKRKNTAIGKPFSVLHLTDTHISPQYVVGASYDCKDELCCTDRQVANATPATAVGPFGDIRGESFCDIPMRTLKTLLVHAKTRNFTHVYLTGDFIPHSSFGYNFKKIVHEIEEQTKVISEGLKGHKIFPSIGNHDDYPAFQFPTHKMHAGNYSIDKLYNALWGLWGGTWVPTDEEKNFKKGGYFTALAQKGLRIFSLNTVYCYKLNWWLAVNPQDPEQQLEWLVAGLDKAEKDGEKVHILGHVPPGTTECKNEWASAYQKIVSRFRHIITGQFFGHLHFDMFSVDFEADTGTPTGVQFAAPSATTYDTGYPSYRIIHLGNQSEVLDMDTYLLNLTRVNAPFMDIVNGMNETAKKVLLEELDKNETAHNEWQLAYSFKKQYDLEDFSPRSFAKLIDRMLKDDELLSRFYRSYFQHRHEPEEIKCQEGNCYAGFYIEPGTVHAVICELYSTGTEQQRSCFKAHERDQLESEHAMLVLAVGGVALTLAAISYLLSID